MPIIFILSPGMDPMNMIQRLAEDMNYLERMEVVSLGKGQGEKAKRYIEKSLIEGSWVVIQNCHLSRSWMPELERIIENYDKVRSNFNDEFRLFLTSMPCEYFPMSVLQNGIKITNEPPDGIRANMERLVSMLTTEQLNSSSQMVNWQRLLVALCFFHTIVLERRKFGSLGWNIPYDFNESDFETSVTGLHSLLEMDEIPWDAIRFTIGDINYGGRVTDEWDRRCLTAILGKFILPNALESGYCFSSSNVYQIPYFRSIDSLKDYVKNLPMTDEPDIFGMHENANISVQKKESSLILRTILET